MNATQTIDHLRLGTLVCAAMLTALSGLATAAEASEPAATATAPPTIDEAVQALADPLAQVERQLEAEEYAEAAHWLEDRVDQIERSSHRFDPRLVRPLTLLGDARSGQGEHADALGLYQRALHLSRINGGLKNPQQIEIVYREADTLKTMGAYQEANDREEYAYDILTRAHDPMDEALLPGIYHLAAWYERTSNVFAARALYEQAMKIIEANDRLETPAAIPALKGIAKSYRMERFPPLYMQHIDQQESSVVVSRAQTQSISVNNFPAGEAALQRIVRIRQAQTPVNRMELAGAVLDLADWYTLFDKTDRAEALYAHAWALMDQVEDFDVAAHFAEPELLYFPAPDNPSPPPPEKRGERVTGYVEVAFDVTDDGYVRGLDTVASQPEGLMDFRVRKSLRIARYRPMLIDGVPVRKTAYTYRHEFPYYSEPSPGEEGEAKVRMTAAGAGSR